MKTRVIFNAEGGTLWLGRDGANVVMHLQDDSGDQAGVLFTPAQWAELCDFFAHPEVNERFDALERQKDAEGEVPLVQDDCMPF